MRGAIVALAAAGALILAGCGHGTPVKRPAAAPAPKIGVLLPTSKGAPRWERVDRPYLQAALTRAGIPFEIRNAQGDRTAFRTIAHQMITGGVTVLLVTSLDDAGGRAVLAEARAHHVTTIDYGRSTMAGGADYLIGYDTARAGRLIGQGLADCLASRKVTNPAVVELDGPPGDGFATTLKGGYDAVLAPRFHTGGYRLAASGPDRSPADAAAAVERVLDRTGRIDGIVAADDALAGAAIGVLRTRGVAGAVAVAGQGGTLDGLRHVLTGEQCTTVYAPARQEAAAGAALAVALARGDHHAVAGLATGTVHNPGPQPAVLLTPESIIAGRVRDVVADGVIDAAALCTPDVATRCRAAGVS